MSFDGLLDIRALEANDDGFAQLDVVGGVDDSHGDHVAAHDAPEDVDEDGLDLLVRVEQLKGLLHLRLRGAATHIEEVGGVPDSSAARWKAMQLIVDEGQVKFGIWNTM